MIVEDISGERAPQMRLIEDDHVIEALSSDLPGSSDHTLLENSASLRGPGLSDHYEGESAAVVIARLAYSRGLRPLRAR